MGILLLGYPASFSDRAGVLNASAFYANLAKNFNWQQDGTATDANGYPTTAPTSNWLANPALAPSYSGHYVWKWTGRGSMQFSPPFVIYSGSSYVSGGVSDGAFNLSVTDQTNPRVEFAFGFNIQTMSAGASNGLGGNLIRFTTKTGFGINTFTGETVVISGQTGQANATGTWVVTQIDNQTYDLQGSTWNSGDPYTGPTGQAILINTNQTVYITTSGTFTSFTNIVVCTLANEATVDAGTLVDPVYKAQVQHLKPSYLRYMDLVGLQFSNEYQIAQRTTKDYISFSTERRVNAYQTTSASLAITRGTSDAYTCLSPSASGGGAYADNETVQGIISGTNLTINPTLNVSGRGAKPILTGARPQNIIFAGTLPSNGAAISFTFSATWLNGGTPYNFSYTKVSGDTTLNTMWASITAAMQADSVLIAGKVSVSNSGTMYVLPRTPQAGSLTIAYTGTSPGLTVTIGTAAASDMVAGYCTFTFNKLMDAWQYGSGGATVAVPFEYMTELCNASGAGCYYCWPVSTQGQYITDVTTYFATNLSAGIKFAGEVGNEMWNFGLVPWGRAVMMGCALGVPFGSNKPEYSYTALRFIQYTVLARAAWVAAGRPSNDYKSLLITWVAQAGVGQNNDLYLMQGQLLDATANTIYGTYGGLGGGSAPTYTASGSRPIDNADASGVAFYWGSHWWSGSANNINPILGTVTDNGPWLQAGKDWANGSTATAYTSLLNQFTGATVSPVFADSCMNWADAASIMAGFETMLASYSRPGPRSGTLAVFSYEGGPQFGLGGNLNAGTNGTAPSDISPLATQMTNLGWNVSAYTVSGTDNKTECATQVIQMVQAWKRTTGYKNMIKTYYYAALAAASPTREVHAAQYGYNGSAWGFFPSTIADTPYTNYDAFYEYNNGI